MPGKITMPMIIEGNTFVFFDDLKILVHKK